MMGAGGCNDFDINLTHLSSLASTNASTAVPGERGYITLFQHFVLIGALFFARLAFVVSKLGTSGRQPQGRGHSAAFPR